MDIQTLLFFLVLALPLASGSRRDHRVPGKAKSY